MITVIFTRFKTLQAPQPLPTITNTKAEAREFFAGMWHGIALGFLMCAACAAILADLLGLI